LSLSHAISASINPCDRSLLAWSRRVSRQREVVQPGALAMERRALGLGRSLDTFSWT
jgi:hypothetical protein